jgi:hypothetical protein
MFQQFDTVALTEARDGVPAGTVCVLLDPLDGGRAWMIECFDDEGETIDVIAAETSILLATEANQGEFGRPAA